MPHDAKVQEAVVAWQGRRALLVGDLVLDAYLYGETVRVSREAPVLVVRQERVDHRLGGAANAAANLAALGVRTELVGLLGDDEAGVRLSAMLEAADVDVAGLVSYDRVTAQKTRVLAGAFGTARQQVLRIDDEPDGVLPLAAAERLATELEDRAGDCDVLIVSDYGAGTVCGPVIEAVRRLAARGVKVCVDSRYQLGLFKGVTAVKPNIPEASALVGFPLTDAAAVHRAGSLLLSQLDCQACLITQGRAGMTLFVQKKPPEHVDIVGEEEVTDVTGAGDTVTAVIGASLAAEIGMANGMRLANCAAGVAVMKAGAATASPAEIVEAAERGGVELAPWGE